MSDKTRLNAHFNEYIDPFILPVPTPTPGVFDEPTTCVQMNRTWSQYMTGLLERMRFTDMWDGSQSEVDSTIQDVEKLLDAFMQDRDCSLDQSDEGCTQIGPTHPAIGYFPHHPTVVPIGDVGLFQGPVWTTGAAGPLQAAGDVLLNIEGVLGGFNDMNELLANGVPSWTLEFSGSGEIDVEFMTRIQGGMAWVFPDGNPLLGDAVSLSYTDVTDFASTQTLFTFLEFLQQDPGIYTRVHSVQFETSGPHTLTAWYLPTGEAEPPWIGYGGGLRAIQLCGDITVDGTVEMPYSLNMSGCTLELLNDGVVVDTVEVQTVVDPCTFEGDVNVNAPWGRALRLHDNQQPTLYQGPGIEFGSSPTPIGSDVPNIDRLAWIQGLWTDVSPTSRASRMDIYLKHAAVSWAKLVLGGSWDFLTIGEDAIGGLFVRNRTLTTSKPMIRVDKDSTGATRIYQLDGNGVINNYRSGGAATLYAAQRHYGQLPGNVGAGLVNEWYGATATASNVPMGYIGFRWDDATQATRKAEFIVHTDGYRTEETDYPIRARHGDTGPEIGFLNADPIARQGIQYLQSEWDALSVTEQFLLTAGQSYGLYDVTINPDTPPCQSPQAGNDWRIKWEDGNQFTTDWEIAPSIGLGLPVNGEWVTEYGQVSPAPFEHNIGIRVLFPALVNITFVEVRTRLEGDALANDTFNFDIRTDSIGNNKLIEEIQGTGVAVATHSWSGDLDVAQLYFMGRIPGNDTGQAVVEFITIEGSGAQPGDITANVCT